MTAGQLDQRVLDHMTHLILDIAWSLVMIRSQPPHFDPSPGRPVITADRTMAQHRQVPVPKMAEGSSLYHC